MKSLRPLVSLISLLLIVGLACRFGATETSTPPPVTEPTKAQSEAVSNVDEVKNATIQIEAQGTFVDPEFGLQVNSAGRGSGFIIDPSGIAVTNNHVVAGAALVKVWVGGESTPRNARVLGLSECSDLAVIQIEGGPYSFLNWYSGTPKTGLEVYAAGYPLGEPEFNLTKGIISKESASGETDWASIDHVLGHDATINPGNSGGPLVTTNGEVVGVNYSSRQTASQYFAIGAEVALPVIDELKTGKDVNSIGVNGIAVLSEDGSLSGIWVASVKSGSPADKAGIQPGDIIYQLEGLVLATDGTMKDYCDVIRSHNSSDAMSLTVIRYSTGELLEGQLNGRELAVTGNFDTGGGSSSGGDSSSSGGTGEAFFTEEFDQDPGSSWVVDVIGPGAEKNKDKVKTEFANSRMRIELPEDDLYFYYSFLGFSYENVRLDLRADNRGVNTNNVSLVCRSSADGWYEWSVGSGGDWYLYAVTDKYNLIAQGGTLFLKQGKEVNEYSMVCKDKSISMFINGQEIKQSPVTDSKYGLRDGTVAFNISSLNVTPVIVEVDWFKISEP